MSHRPDTDDYRALFLADAPMMDMRAPAEFSQGAFPSASSLPLMSDDERAQVGICYKQRGQEEAIALGHRLVAGQLRDTRIAQWSDFARQHPAQQGENENARHFRCTGYQGENREKIFTAYRICKVVDRKTTD